MDYQGFCPLKNQGSRFPDSSRLFWKADYNSFGRVSRSRHGTQTLAVWKIKESRSFPIRPIVLGWRSTMVLRRFRGTADFVHVVVRPWFSLCPSQNVDFPMEYEGFWTVGICGHAAGFNNAVPNPWFLVCRS